MRRKPASSGWAGLGRPRLAGRGGVSSVQELDDLEWRWEFLRRRHGYRLDWLRPDADFHPASREQYFLELFDLQLPFDPRLSIRKLAEGLSTRARRGSKEVLEYPVSGLVPFRRGLLSSLFATYPELGRIVPEAPSEDDIFARFDLGLPIKPQLEQIGYLLGKLRAEAYGANADATRKQKQLWATYLRILDAKDAGASLNAMARTLPGTRAHTPQQARAAVEAAEQLRLEWRHGSRLTK